MSLKRIFFCILVCSCAAWGSAPADAAYAPGWSHAEGGDTNPYQLRRQAALEKTQNTAVSASAPASDDDSSHAPPPVKMTTESKPLRIVIPNLNAIRQMRHDTPVILSHADYPALVAASKISAAAVPAPTRMAVAPVAVAAATPVIVPSAAVPIIPAPVAPAPITVAAAMVPEAPAPVEAAAPAPVIHSYTSPGIIIKRIPAVVLGPENEAADAVATPLPNLSPSAGSADTGDAPLIQLPPASAPAATSADLPPLKPLLAPPAAAPQTVTAPAPIVVPDMPPALPQKSLEEVLQKPAEAAPTAAVIATPVPAEVPSEPAPLLSKSSEDILKKIPSGIDKPKKNAKSIAIDHAKDTSDIGQSDEPITVKHESMGVKLEVKKQSADWNYELEKAYNASMAGYSSTAIDIYKNVLDNDPKNKNALFGLATTYHRAGQLDLARPLYGRLLAIDPDNRDALNNFLVLLADEAPEAALEQMEKLEGRNPDFSPIPAQMAVIYQKLGQTDKATEKMLRAVSLAPENLSYRYNLAIMLDKQHKYDEAAKLYQELLEAYQRGEVLPGNIQKIQERLTFISSNRP